MSGETVHISIVGLPASGKTTFLAALWHMVREAGAVTALSFEQLSDGNYEHLNALAKLWRQGKIQQRTQLAGMRTVSMRLKTGAGQSVQVTFPDVPGEDFSRMWEKRDLDKAMVDTLSAPSILLLVNGDTIQFPAWVVERMALAKAIGLPRPAVAEDTEWSADLAPTQVKVVDLLQMLMADDLDLGERRLALVLSAWDRVAGEGLTPEELLSMKMPLLDQYLRSGRDPWNWSVWGVSAQGGVYEDPEKDEKFAETDVLRDLDRASDRIKVVGDDGASTDITRPLDWLIG
jgi:hypothetical protein